MSDRPTPETDALTSVGLENAAHECVPSGFARKLERERDEARKRASDLALGVKVADCVYDYGEYSVALREAKIRARYLQDLTRAAYDEVEKLEDQEGAK